MVKGSKREKRGKSSHNEGRAGKALRDEPSGLLPTSLSGSALHALASFQTLQGYKLGSLSINIYLCKRSQVYCLLQSYLFLKLIKIGAGQFCKLSQFNVNNNKKRRQKPERREKTKMKPVKEKKQTKKKQPRIRGL